MRIVRFVHNDAPTYGVVEGDLPEAAADGTLDTSELEIAVLDGDPFFSPAQSTGAHLKYDDVRLIAPIIPRSKVIGVGRNFADHAKELGNEVPASPLTFFKPNTAVVGPGDPIRLPAISEKVSYEAELAVVISRVAKNVPAEKAYEYVLGYTAANDVTLRDIQQIDKQWSRAKGFDTSCPLGPWIETDLDPEGVRIRSWVNGELKQDGNTDDFIFDIPTVIEHLSEVITLLPGDVILTGTPEGVGAINAGDRVDIAIDGLGLLSNPVLDA
ncbi:fumarylacetoacetate hydrolase family protein [Brevibacterium sp. 50QC2O2]|jgi:2-keto-4-pentenoate hydratase/2-oxohepta-3-ene-1,7-dioic acid hydratase in catechol pathway|uniref:fumarylacetoacetate hydrolase family protein n=1 Tax=Brevibacterium TaxID=1696 RepID=UPI00211C4A25|nr:MULTISPECIES: fumarylacetoacetate hydrolase family protein [unclassified Brevibacterium]MCQ9367814.1 fumarylacetoacetate hydrolase family protein [Brevibacterium sp. 91QC2O2]MCQ9384880.1 fumarylacetoacetate hydrolase family protein [Brevibacterium sp. 68QC2CO]MCQ9388073.1 fumarylacetoacetate hydrolase family protein [Brevibacterium sp. 50QC2O2]